MYIRVPIAEGVLEQQHNVVRVDGHIGRLVLQQVSVILIQFLIAHDHVFHAAVPAFDAIGPQNPGQNPGHPPVDHVPVNDVVVNHRQTAVDAGGEQLLHCELLHVPGVGLVQLQGWVHVQQNVLVQHLPAVFVQILLVGKVQQHLLGQQMAVITGKGVEKILVQPRQIHAALQSQFVPLERARPPAVPLDQDTADCGQNLHPGVQLVQPRHQPLVHPAVVAQGQSQMSGLFGQFPAHHGLSGSQVQRLDLKISQGGHKIRMVLQQAAGRGIQEGAAAALLVHGFHAQIQLQRILL